jgi:hypothetical protein
VWESESGDAQCERAAVSPPSLQKASPGEALTLSFFAALCRPPRSCSLSLRLLSAPPGCWRGAAAAAAAAAAAPAVTAVAGEGAPPSAPPCLFFFCLLRGFFAASTAPGAIERASFWGGNDGNRESLRAWLLNGYLWCVE